MSPLAWILLVVLLIAVLPNFGGYYGPQGWQYGGGLGIILLIVLVVVLIKGTGAGHL